MFLLSIISNSRINFHRGYDYEYMNVIVTKIQPSHVQEHVKCCPTHGQEYICCGMSEYITYNSYESRILLYDFANYNDETGCNVNEPIHIICDYGNKTKELLFHEPLYFQVDHYNPLEDPIDLILPQYDECEDKQLTSIYSDKYFTCANLTRTQCQYSLKDLKEENPGLDLIYYFNQETYTYVDLPFSSISVSDVCQYTCGSFGYGHCSLFDPPSLPPSTSRFVNTLKITINSQNFTTIENRLQLFITDQIDKYEGKLQSYSVSNGQVRRNLLDFILGRNVNTIVTAISVFKNEIHADRFETIMSNITTYTNEITEVTILGINTETIEESININKTVHFDKRINRKYLPIARNQFCSEFLANINQKAFVLLDSGATCQYSFSQSTNRSSWVFDHKRQKNEGFTLILPENKVYVETYIDIPVSEQEIVFDKKINRKTMPILEDICCSERFRNMNQGAYALLDGPETCQYNTEREKWMFDYLIEKGTGVTIILPEQKKYTLVRGNPITFM